MRMILNLVVEMGVGMVMKGKGLVEGSINAGVVGGG